MYRRTSSSVEGGVNVPRLVVNVADELGHGIGAYGLPPGEPLGHELPDQSGLRRTAPSRFDGESVVQFFLDADL